MTEAQCSKTTCISYQGASAPSTERIPTTKTSPTKTFKINGTHTSLTNDLKSALTCIANTKRETYEKTKEPGFSQAHAILNPN